MCNTMRRNVQSLTAAATPVRFLACWLITIVGGIFWLNAYSLTSGLRAESLESYPANASVDLSQEHPTLCVFLHPKCSCSRATLSELARLSATRDGFDIQSLFFLPDGESQSWAKTDLWKTACQLSTIEPIFDRDGELCRKFKITTSGHVMLFSPDGKMMYSGGITDGRGHEGDNPGSSTLKQILDGESVAIRELPVFGCPISSIERIENAN